MQVSRKMRPSRNNKVPFSRYLDEETGLHEEEFFNERLSFERIRLERSKSTLMMMLFDIKKLKAGDKKKTAIVGIKNVLVACSRDTDIYGWFKQGEVIGIILVEANRENAETIKKRIVERLYSELDMTQIRDLAMSFQVLDSQHEGPQVNKSEDLLFYANTIALPRQKRYRTNLKRGIDIVSGITGLVIFSPVFLLVPILIKMSSAGPIFFKQERVGLNGKRFTFLKFRSMEVNNDTSEHQKFVSELIKGQSSEQKGSKEVSYKMKNDRRVTRIGRFLRKTSIDEFPQFINVLRGDMSLVGPRPPIPYELENYAMWHKRRLLEVRPGITGLWQVKGRSACSFDEMVRLDLQYIKEFSNRSDLKIMAKTPWVMFSGKGGY